MDKNFDKRVKAYMSEMESLSKKLKIEVSPMVNFKSGKAGLFGRFAIFLLVRAGGFLDTRFTNLKK